VGIDATGPVDLAKLVDKEKREQREKAQRELERQILMEAHVRGNFHRALERWLERLKVNPKTNPVDGFPSA
jgi:hypothetical protein